MTGKEKVDWLMLHQDHCDVNHTGSSSSMETDSKVDVGPVRGSHECAIHLSSGMAILVWYLV